MDFLIRDNIIGAKYFYYADMDVEQFKDWWRTCNINDFSEYLCKSDIADIILVKTSEDYARWNDNTYHYIYLGENNTSRLVLSDGTTIEKNN